MVTLVPRAKKMMMFFGPHSRAHIPQFQACFRGQEHPGKRKVLILECGFALPDEIINIGGQATWEDYHESIQAKELSTRLSRAIKAYDELLRGHLLGTLDDEKKGILPESAVFTAAVMREAIEKGYQIKSERLHPESVFNSWLQVESTDQIIGECLEKASPDHERAYDLMREQYGYYYAFHTLRDEELLRYMDALAENNDTLCSVRGINHIGFFRRLSDPPGIFPYSDRPELMGELITKGVKPGELSRLDLAIILKENIWSALVLAKISGLADHSEADRIRLLGKLPNDLSELEKFCMAVADPDRDKMLINMLKHFSASNVGSLPPTGGMSLWRRVLSVIEPYFRGKQTS